MKFDKLRKIINEYKDKIIINHPKCKINRDLLVQYKNLFKSASEMIYLVKNYNNLENLHMYCYCGNKNNFVSINNGYHKYCSIKCEVNDENIQKKQKLTKLNNIDKNGLNSYQRQIIKANKTKLNNIDKDGLNSFQRIVIKRKQTMLNNIDENGLNGYQQVAKKAANTMKNVINKNGLSIYQNAANKTKQTRFNIINQNGLNSYQIAAIKGNKTKLNTIDENGLNSNQRGAKKAKKTKKQKYGIEGYNNIVKQYQTKKKNHTFNVSKDEEKVYNYLLQKFNKDDIERQYRSKLYPFYSDFYIKSLDLYIEYHGTWTHYKKPFKHSVEDMKIIEQLKKKSQEINFKGERKLFYLSVLNVWTKSDPLKLQTFKKNKLNYKIFYNMNQFDNWYRKI